MLKKFRALLFTGILLIIIGFILTLLVDTEMSIDENSIMGLLFGYPAYFVILLTIILAPLIEEFAFRLWGVGEKWCFAISFVLISGYLFFVVGFWTFVFELLFLGIYFLLKRKELLQKYLFASITSLAFALIHIGNVELSGFLTICPIYIGIGLILSYLTLRFRFIYSISGHAIWNFTISWQLGVSFLFRMPNQNHWNLAIKTIAQN